MKSTIKGRINSFKYAFEGLFWAFKKHINYRIHAILSLLVICLGFYFHLSEIEWVIIIMTIILGFVIETINTAIEATTDAIDKNWRHDIKLAKDVSAAAMLIYSFGAIIIAMIIFFNKIYS